MRVLQRSRWLPPGNHIIVLLATLLQSTECTVYEAVATIQSSTLPAVAGTVRFSQDFGSPCVHVTANISGLPDGLHGFHVHQYGDLTSDTDKSSLGAHFTP